MSYVDVVSSGDDIVVWERDEGGNLITRAVPNDDYLYCFIPQNGEGESEFKNIYGKPVKKVFFDKSRDIREFADGRETFESDVPLKYRFLIDEYFGKQTNPTNTLFYDIEVDFDLSEGHGHPKPKNPYGEINLIQTFDNNKKIFTMFIDEALRGEIELSDKDYPVEIRWFTSEPDLLNEFAAFLDERTIDFLAGWYVSMFDLPYIMERAIKLFGEKKAVTMFCRDGFKATKREFIDDYGEEVWEWQFSGRKNVDMLALYKTFIPSEQTSFSLDSIAFEELGVNKVDVDDGDLGEMYRNNPQKFCEYGLRDVQILKWLDDKLTLMETANMMATSSCVLISDVTGSVKPIENSFMGFCKERGIVLPDKKSHDKEEFEGAIVYDTIAGRHGWTFSADLTALYPSAMIMLGLSVETFIYQLLGGFDDYVAVMSRNPDVTVTVEDVVSNDKFDVTASEMYDIIIENGFCISANGSVFNGDLGLIAEFVQTVFVDRKKNRAFAEECEKNGDSARAKIFDLRQKVLKRKANSSYGCISNNYFRLFDIRLAKSITLTGQVISKQQAYRANSVLNELMGEV